MRALWLGLLLAPAVWAAPATLDVGITAGSDDAEEARGGAVSLNSSDLELVCDVTDQVVGIRFAKVQLPAGAKLTRAFVQFTCKDATNSPAALTIHTERTPVAAPFAATTSNLSSRVLTKATASWSPPPWAAGESGAAERTPDLTPLVQEVIGLPGWQNGNPLALILTGSGLRRAWACDGDAAHAPRLHIEWDDAAPAAASAPVSSGQEANAFLDNVRMFGERMLEIPASTWIVGVIGVTLIGLLAVGWLGHARRWERWAVAIVFVAGAGAAVLFVVRADRRAVELERELRALRSKTTTDPLGLLDVVSERTTARKQFLLDERAVRVAIGPARVSMLIYDEATDVAFVRLTQTVAQVYVAVLDLTHPKLEIEIGANTGSKRLTSAFARERGCSVAINGEAGNSPAANSGLGGWTGNMVVAGKPTQLEDTAQRPFLVFDRQNKARYASAALVQKVAQPDWFNVIWGRHDVLRAGALAVTDNQNRQPRTAMAINAAGTRLVLLVADGRQPGYSMGLSMVEVGRLLQAFGATDGMLCDEGGSSCLWLAKFGGIANVPSDNRGRERPTYTHFGVRLKRP